MRHTPRFASHVSTERMRTASIPASSMACAVSSSISFPASTSILGRSSSSSSCASVTSSRATQPTRRSRSGSMMSSPSFNADIIEPLRERLVGCVALDEVTDAHELDEDERPKGLVEAGKLITEETAQAIEDAGIEAGRLRAVLTCGAERGGGRQVYRR